MWVQSCSSGVSGKGKGSERGRAISLLGAFACLSPGHALLLADVGVLPYAARLLSASEPESGLLRLWAAVLSSLPEVPSDLLKDDAFAVFAAAIPRRREHPCALAALCSILLLVRSPDATPRTAAFALDVLSKLFSCGGNSLLVLWAYCEAMRHRSALTALHHSWAFTSCRRILREAHCGHGHDSPTPAGGVSSVQKTQPHSLCSTYRDNEERELHVCEALRVLVGLPSRWSDLSEGRGLADVLPMASDASPRVRLAAVRAICRLCTEPSFRRRAIFHHGLAVAAATSDCSGGGCCGSVVAEGAGDMVRNASAFTLAFRSLVVLSVDPDGHVSSAASTVLDALLGGRDVPPIGPTGALSLSDVTGHALRLLNPVARQSSDSLAQWERTRRAAVETDLPAQLYSPRNRALVSRWVLRRDLGRLVIGLGRDALGADSQLQLSDDSIGETGGSSSTLQAIGDESAIRRLEEAAASIRLSAESDTGPADEPAKDDGGQKDTRENGRRCTAATWSEAHGGFVGDDSLSPGLGRVVAMASVAAAVVSAHAHGVVSVTAPGGGTLWTCVLPGEVVSAAPLDDTRVLLVLATGTAAVLDTSMRALLPPISVPLCAAVCATVANRSLGDKSALVIGCADGRIVTGDGHAVAHVPGLLALHSVPDGLLALSHSGITLLAAPYGPGGDPKEPPVAESVSLGCVHAWAFHERHALVAIVHTRDGRTMLSAVRPPAASVLAVCDAGGAWRPASRGSDETPPFDGASSPNAPGDSPAASTAADEDRATAAADDTLGAKQTRSATADDSARIAALMSAPETRAPDTAPSADPADADASVDSAGGGSETGAPGIAPRARPAAAPALAFHPRRLLLAAMGDEAMVFAPRSLHM